MSSRISLTRYLVEQQRVDGLIPSQQAATRPATDRVVVRSIRY